MNQPQSLAAYFSGWAATRPARLAVAATVGALVTAAIEMGELVGQGALAGPLGRLTGRKGDVDEQKEVDLLANNRIIDVLSGAPVAAVASEEMDAPLLLDEKAPLLVAVDPLDGSSNIDANVSIGMIFTVLPALGAQRRRSAFLQPGVNQLAGGFFVYGPQRCWWSRSAPATQIFTLDRRSVDVHPHASEGRDPRATPANIADQRFQFAPLGRSGPQPTSRNAAAVRTARAARTSTCAGPPRRSPTSTASCLRGGVYLYPATQAPGSATGGCG